MNDLRTKLIRIFVVFAITLVCNAATADIVGQKAPSITVKQWVTPEPPRSSELEERVYVVEFWATWCRPCMDEIPHIIKLADKYKDKGVLFIGISEDQSIEDVKKAVQENKINYHIGLDRGTRKKYKNNFIPCAFVVSHLGRITWQGHPAERGFEPAIARALAAAPPPFLDGIEFGPFENLKGQLCGGMDFIRAYRWLESKARDSNCEDNKTAAAILIAIEDRISKKIEDANSVRATEPARAFELYGRIAKNYKGAKATESANAIYNEMKNNPQLQKEVAATETAEKAERLLTRCQGCDNCKDFNPACSRCIWLNEIAVGRAVKLLKNICENYKDTKAATAAQKKLEEFDSKALQTISRNDEAGKKSEQTGLQQSQTQNGEEKLN